MSDSSNEYRSIFKATGLFGGVQVITILISIAKTKLVAVWLGASGFGIMSILNSASLLISSLSNLGLQSSAVRDIAASHAKGDKLEVANTIIITNRLALFTSILGGFITIALSALLSEFFFNNKDYILPFLLLSTVIFFTGIYSQNLAILQGTRNLRYLAKSSVLGAFLGFLFSIPIFYFFRESGIVWALIIGALISMVISYFFVKKLQIARINQSYFNSLKNGLSTVKLGIYIALSNNITYLVQFLLKAYISRNGNIDDVGLFQAGWAINAQYVGLVFTAMGKDYFPRLCQSADNNKAIRKKVIEQGEIGLLLLTPMIAVMLAFMPLFIKLLYTDDFISVVPMTKLLMIGTLIQAASWGLGYVFLAKNDGKIYFINEVVTKVIMLPLYLLGYHFGKLEGLGYSFIINNAIYLIWIIIVAKKRYQITYSSGFIKLFLLFFFTLSSYFVIEKIINIPIYLKFIIVFIIVSYTIYELDKRINIVSLIRKHLFKL